jgi:hypothetical protein
MRFSRHLFVKLETLNDEMTVDFELSARFLDSQRTEVPIRVRTNPLKIQVPEVI